MDLILRKDKFLLHIGLAINKKCVLHFASATDNMFASDQTVRTSTFYEFANGRPVKTIPVLDQHLTEIQILKNAQHYPGRGKKYSILSNNCITFIMWCLYRLPSRIKNIHSFSNKYKIRWFSAQNSNGFVFP